MSRPDPDSAPGQGEQEARFAAELADALGPLYRVSVEGPGGQTEAAFGRVHGRAARAEIVLPGSDRMLVVEVDTGALEEASRVLEALTAGGKGLAAGGSTSFPHLDDALGELITMSEGLIGRPISEMSRGDKQRLVGLLDQRGAFTLRKSVETVADVLGVSRFTVYNYLDSVRSEDPSE